MSYSFTAYGHPNITGTHETTLEFTKDKEITKRASCIIGVNSDFDLAKLKDFIKKNKNKKIMLTINLKKNNKIIEDRVTAFLNHNFNDEKELILRKSDFISERTFAIRADKASAGLDRELISLLKQKSQGISIYIQKI